MTLVAGIPAKTDPLAAVRSLAQAAAEQRGASFVDSGLRLFDRPSPSPSESAEAREAVSVAAAGRVSPFALGRTYELLLAPTQRRKRGSHLTPEAVARNLVAMMPATSTAARVLDPAVGGAAFLLAAADRLVAAGARPVEVRDQLLGYDIDPGAVAVAEAAVSLWALDHGLAPRPLLSIVHGDGLLDELPVVDQVVGNPPFLNQLRTSSSHTADRRAALRDRWGELVSAYTDDAWLFLAAGVEALKPGASLAMVQPVSLLAARHGHAVREFVHERATVDGLWIARDKVFDAAVQVCGVVTTRDGDRTAPMRRAVGADFESCAPLPIQPGPHEWGSAGAATLGVPAVTLQSERTVGDLATATAGFRDQFYGFVPFVHEAARPQSDSAKFVTVGMIDVLGLQWGNRTFKFAKRDFERPVVDLEALRIEDPRLAAWTDARLRPKLLMATQTRVVEVWVDEQGETVPATPVLSIEPHDQDVDSLWMLAAALSAPAMSAYFHAAKFGTAMSLNSMKIAAKDVLAAPLPTNQTAWVAGAELLRTDATNLDTFAVLMDDAYGVTDPNLRSWWRGRV